MKTLLASLALLSVIGVAATSPASAQLGPCSDTAGHALNAKACAQYWRIANSVRPEVDHASPQIVAYENNFTVANGLQGD